MLEIEKKDFLGHFYNTNQEEDSTHLRTSQEFVNLLLEILEFLNFEYQADFNFENLLGLSNIKNLQALLENKYVLPDFLQDKIINYLAHFKNNNLSNQEYYYPNKNNNPFSPFNNGIQSVLSLLISKNNKTKYVRILKNDSTKVENPDLVEISDCNINSINEATIFSLSKGKTHKFSSQILTTFLKISLNKNNIFKLKNNNKKNTLTHLTDSNYKINLMFPSHKKIENINKTPHRYSKFLFTYNELKYNYIQYLLIKKVLIYIKNLSIYNSELEVPIPNHNIVNELFN
jgi:hypothetical protein